MPRALMNQAPQAGRAGIHFPSMASAIPAQAIPSSSRKWVPSGCWLLQETQTARSKPAQEPWGCSLESSLLWSCTTSSVCLKLLNCSSAAYCKYSNSSQTQHFLKPLGRTHSASSRQLLWEQAREPHIPIPYKEKGLSWDTQGQRTRSCVWLLHHSSSWPGSTASSSRVAKHSTAVKSTRLSENHWVLPDGRKLTEIVWRLFTAW